MDLDTEKTLKRFTVYKPDTLFDIDQKEMFFLLKENRCLKCGNKLKFARSGKIAYCRSVKHRKPFIISIAKLQHINGK